MALSGFEGKVALVTGAGSGIGAAVARMLGEAGARVAVTDLSLENARAVADSIGPSPLAQAWACDVSSTARVERVVAEAEAALGEIELLANVAGIFETSPLLELSDEQFERVIAVNARGVLACLRAVGRRMVSRGRGAIVTVASQSSQIVRVEQGGYGASKAAATYLTKCLGLELAGKGIRCNVVHPGVTETPLATRLWEMHASSKDAHLTGNLARYRIGVPLAKIARAEEVASAVIFLLSEQASHITLQDLLVDGGQTLAV